MKSIVRFIIASLFVIMPFTANAGQISWSLSSSWTAPTSYDQVWGDYVPNDGNSQFCSICSGCCDIVFVTVTLRHPQQSQLSVYVNVNGNGVSLTSTPQEDGSVKYEGSYSASINPTVSLHLKSNSGSSIVIDPSTCGTMLSITASNGH